MSNLGSLVVSLEANIAKFQGDLGKAAAIAEARAREIEKSFDIVKTGLGALGIGFAFGATMEAVKAKIEGVIESAAGLQQLSERTGASVEALSGLASIAKQSGTDTESLATGLQKLSKSMIDAQNGGQKTGAAFDAIGISAKDLKGAAPEAIFQKIAKQLDLYQDGAEKVVVAQNLLGKSGANLLPLLKDLAEQGEYQVKVTAEQAAQADALVKNQERLQQSTNAIFKTIGLETIPVFNAFTKALLDTQNANNGVRGEVGKLAKDGSIREWAEDAVKAVGFVIDAFDGVSRVAIIVGKALGADAAASVSILKGEFKQAGTIFSDFMKDADAIANRELFSTRLDKQLVSATADPDVPRVRKKLPASALGNANQGPKDDPMRKILDGRIKREEDFIAAEKTQLATREQYLEFYRGLEYFTLADTEQKKQDLITDNLRVTQAAYDKEIADLTIYIASAEKLTEQQDGRNKRDEVIKKRAAAEVEANKQIGDSVNKLFAVQRQFDLATIERDRQQAKAVDALRFQTSLLGGNTLAVQQAVAAKQIQLDLDERIYQLRKQDPGADVSDAILKANQQQLDMAQAIAESYNKQRDGAYGASEAMRKYAEEASNNAALIENALTNAFKNAEDALVNFVKTGKLDFSSLVDSIITDLIRIQIKQQIIAPASQLLSSSGGSGLGSFFSSAGSFFKNILGFANGGDPPVGVPSIVGENGPELFVPRAAGTVIPNGASSGGVTVHQPIYLTANNASAETVGQIRALFPAFLAENKRSVEGIVQQAARRNGGRVTA